MKARLTLKVPVTTAVDDVLKYFFLLFYFLFFFLIKTSFDVSCKLSVSGKRMCTLTG